MVVESEQEEGTSAGALVLGPQGGGEGNNRWWEQVAP